ncbi:MAG: DUF4824 family protein [Deltaproteobacteria bacterium]|nr:DUF4824 family protein [Deltaproteobacteria bacterium]
MKILVTSRALFALVFVILAATNIVVLSGVAANRSGEPEAQIILTERELRLPYQVHEENSGLALQLAWRVLGKDEDDNGYPGWMSPVWFSAEKLAELGFTINEYPSANDDTIFSKQPVPKEVFIVLEYDGESYRAAVMRAEAARAREEGLYKSNPGEQRLRDDFDSAEKRLERECIAETRLFAIDAGLDLGVLREKYGDQTHYVITKGLVELRYDRGTDKKEVHGYISGLSVASIHVPLEHREIFDAMQAKGGLALDESGSPRYEVKLAYGNRLEPWIISAKLLDDGGSQ